MINAAIVGLGWWGEDSCGVRQGNERLHSIRCRCDAHHFTGSKNFTETHKLILRRIYDALLADQRSMPCRSCDAGIPSTGQVLLPPGRVNTFSARSVCAYKAMRKPPWRPTRKAGVTLGLGYNRRFHPEMTKTSRTHTLRRAGHRTSCRSDNDISKCVAASAHTMARTPR